MKGNRLIKNKLEENNEVISDSNFKRWAGIVGAFVIAGASYTAALALHATAPEYSIPLALFGTYFPIGGVAYFDEKSDSMAEAKKRNQHLESIQNEGVSKDKGLDQARSLRISLLEEKKSELLRKLENNAFFITLGTCAWIAGSVATIFTQPAMWAGIGGLLVSGLAYNAYGNNEKKYMEYDTRAENLTNDLVLGPVYEKEDVKEDTDTKIYHTVKGKAIPNPSYEETVNQYVDALSHSTEESIPNQKVKK